MIARVTPRRPVVVSRVAAAVLVPVVVLLAATSACARQPITTTATGGDPAPVGTGATVTTRPGTTTSGAPAATAPPATDGTTPPATTDGGTPVYDVNADVEITASVGQTFELHVAEDTASGFAWKADQSGTSVAVSAVRREEPLEAGAPATIVGVYSAVEAGTTTVTFSAAMADGTPGDQWKVTITVA